MIEFDSKKIDEEAFEKNYKDAQAYHTSALTYKENNQRASLVFNVASVALERYLVALCDLYGEVVMNHNYISLVMTVELFMDIPQTINSKIRNMDRIFNICSVEECMHSTPEENDMINVLELCDYVKDLFDQDRIAKLRGVVLAAETQTPV